MNKIWPYIILGLSVLVFSSSIFNSQNGDISPDMGSVIPYHNPRQACNSSTVGLISRWVGDPYSTKALLCITDERGWYGWAELHDVEP